MMYEYLSADYLAQIFEAAGGNRNQPGVPKALENCAGRPARRVIDEQPAYPDIHAKAAALFECIVLKRIFEPYHTAFALYAVPAFYIINGYVVRAHVAGLALWIEDKRPGVDEIARQLALSDISEAGDLVIEYDE